MKIKPLFDRVVIEPCKDEEEIKGGIILPSVAQDKSQLAKVVAIGNGVLPEGKSVEMQVSVGDKVLYAKYSGTEIEEKGKKYIVIRQADILAVIE